MKVKSQKRGFSEQSVAPVCYFVQLRIAELTAYTEITQKYEQQRDVCWLLERSPEKAIDTVDKNAQALIDRFEED